MPWAAQGMHHDYVGVTAVRLTMCEELRGPFKAQSSLLLSLFCNILGALLPDSSSTCL